jgi:hypothetical protein
MSVYTGFNVVGTLLFSLLSGKLIDGWFGYRFTDTLGELYGESYAGTKAATGEISMGTITYGTVAPKVIRSAAARFFQRRAPASRLSISFSFQPRFARVEEP